MTATELAHALAAKAEETARHLLPNGRQDHGNWVTGSVQDDQGKSLHVQLTGPKAGVWLDFASGEKGDLIGLWQATTGLSLKDSCAAAMQFLGIEPEPELRPEPTKAWTQLQREMGQGTEGDIAILQALRRLPSDAGLQAAIESGHLFFGPVFDKPANAAGIYHHSWIITDSERIGAQARRMDGQPYGDGQKSKTIHGTTGRWPIGIADLPTGHQIALVEGGPDFLAAYTACAMLGLLDGIQPISMLGSQQHIHPEALPKFANKTVWIFPHKDENLAGLQGAIKWDRAIRGAGAAVIPFDFRPYSGVKDLNDFVSALCPAPAQACEWEE